MSDIPALLERFRRAPEVLATALAGLSGEEEDLVSAPGKWSIRQIVAHVADAELVGAHRFRQVIAEDNPTLIAFDQDAWTRNLDYARRNPMRSLETFHRIRSENYQLLVELADADWDRTGNHSENGLMTLRRLLEGYTGHAESHARQIQEIRDAYRASAASVE
ncbi:MAG: DinB family protein [Candidatus Solibacter sp.]|jgi:uncharacterized damage-inducible protein DinB